MKLKIGIVGSRIRNSISDWDLLVKTVLHLKKDRDIKIITGDCDKGGDKFARELADKFNFKKDVKRIRHPETGEEMDFNNHPYFDYLTMCKIFYDRDEEIAKEDLDYLIALKNPYKNGGTEYTISRFKHHHKDWEKKLIIL